MFSSGLLILTKPLTHLKKSISAILKAASTCIENTLYVHIAPGTQFDTTNNSPVQPLLIPNGEVGNFVLQMYGGAASVCSNLDIRILLGNIHSSSFTSIPPQTLSHPLHVILADEVTEKLPEGYLARYCQENFNTNTVIPVKSLCDYGFSCADSSSAVEDKPETLKSYKHVCLGGTFDRLHTGHKILLTEACIRCDSKLTIGVTDGPMTASKTLDDLIEPTAHRISVVQELISDVRPSIQHEVVPIIDPFGPSIVYPDIDCLVVSQETLKGGHAVNKKRLEKGMSEVELYVVDLVEDECRNEDEEVKISSSSLRKRLLGSLLKEPRTLQSEPGQPYLIGLTGGIASGKSSICKRLAKLGAGTVDCDKLGHQAYDPGMPAYAPLLEEFGEGILDKETKKIDRAKLSQSVFGDESKRQRLNAIVWPAVADLALAEVDKLAAQGVKVVILEAALIFEAKWETKFNEVWVTFIPKKEMPPQLDSDLSELSLLMPSGNCDNVSLDSSFSALSASWLLPPSPASADVPPVDTSSGCTAPAHFQQMDSSSKQNDSGYMSSSTTSSPSSTGISFPSQPLELGVPAKALLESIYANWQTETLAGPQQKPEESYLSMIARCMLGSVDGWVVMADIYSFILDRHPYFRTAKPTWKNGVRHCLSVNDCFVKGRRSTKGRGYMWSIHPACLESFKQGDFTSRQARHKAQRHSRKSQAKVEANTSTSLQTSQSNYVQMTSTPMQQHSQGHTYFQRTDSSSYTSQQLTACQSSMMSAQERFAAIQTQYCGYYNQHQGYVAQTLGMDYRH